MLYALVIAKIAMSRAKGRVIKVPLMISPDVDAIQKLLPCICRKWLDVIFKNSYLYFNENEEFIFQVGCDSKYNRWII